MGPVFLRHSVVHLSCRGYLCLSQAGARQMYSGQSSFDDRVVHVATP